MAKAITTFRRLSRNTEFVRREDGRTYTKMVPTFDGVGWINARGVHERRTVWVEANDEVEVISVQK